jgi:hypothetical protein
MGIMHHRVVFPLLSVIAGWVLAPLPAGAAPPTWPSAYVVWADGFEDPGLSDIWEDYGEGAISVEAAAACPPSGGGLAVDVSGESQAYLQRYNLTEWPHLEYPRDTYVRFSFNPAGVSIPPGETVSLLRLRDGDWNVMAGLRLRQEASGYAVFLEVPDGTSDTTALPLPDGWSTIVVGCRMHDWVGVWVDDGTPRVVTGVEHAADFVQVLILGKADGNWSGSTPSGTVFFDDVTLLFGAYPELWVDARTGDDAGEGTTSDAPLRTIGMAAMLTSPGTVVHIGPGDYRESVVAPVDGTAEAPIRFEASEGRGTAWILGSNPASDVSWSRLTTAGEIDLPPGVNLADATIFKADLSSWGLDGPPRFVVVRGADGSTSRLPLAREPDWQAVTAWKHHEFWWAAEGGDEVTTCDPAAEPDCDEPQRSDRVLVDYHDDAEPAGIEPGSLASLGDVTGAIMFVKDCWSGHYTYKRRVSETVEPGKVRLEALPETYWEGCWFDHDPANPALGWNSKYFLEGLARFMDTPGEWVFDEATGAIYIWTPDGSPPDALGVEISVRDTGFELSHRSYVELADLGLALFEEEGVRVSNGDNEKSHGLALTGLDIGWSTRGIYLGQDPQPGSPEDSQIRHVVLADSRVHDMESLAIFYWAGSGEAFVRPGITDVLISHNDFENIGFRDNEQGSVGMGFTFADHLLFEHNHVHHIAHCGVHFSQGKTRSSRGYDLAPEEILTGDILVRGNLFEDTVENATDAGGLKFWGATADHTDIFRDVLVIDNVSRNNVGWAWVSQERENWTYHGKGGMGYYIDFAGGIHFFRNIAYENGLAGFMASGSWIDQPVVLANNTIVSSPLGYTLGTRGAYADSTTGLDVLNTIFLHLQEFAIGVGEAEIMRGNVSIDYDLFHLVGYEPWTYHTPGIMAGHVDDSGYSELPTLADVQGTLGLEMNGVEADPMLASFDPDVADGSWQDFRLTEASTAAIDTGTELPASLVALLAKFGLDDGRKGSALDRGAIELDPANPDAPFVIDVGPRDAGGEIEPPWEPEYPESTTEPGVDGGNGENGAEGCGCAVAR